MNLKLILAGSGAALVPVVAVPIALGLSNNTSTEKPSELSVPERSSVPDLSPIPPSQELRDTTVSQLPRKSPFPPPFPFPASIEVASFESLSPDLSPETSDQNSEELRVRRQALAGPVKTKLSGFGSSFGYDQIESKKGNRKEQFKSFVEQTDKLREASKKEIKDLLSKEEFQNKDFRAIFEQDLGFDLILQSRSPESYRFINLALIRQSEVETQIEKDKSKEGKQPTKVGDRVTREDIIKFCQDPSEANSHLGMHSSSRTSEEETKEYMFFNYYSYCSKESYYIKLYFDSYHWQSH